MIGAAAAALAAKKREAAALLAAAEQLPPSVKLTAALDRAFRAAERMLEREPPGMHDPGIAAVAAERGEIDVDTVGPCTRNGRSVFRLFPLKVARIKEK